MLFFIFQAVNSWPIFSLLPKIAHIPHITKLSFQVQRLPAYHIKRQTRSRNSFTGSLFSFSSSPSLQLPAKFVFWGTRSKFFQSPFAPTHIFTTGYAREWYRKLFSCKKLFLFQKMSNFGALCLNYLNQS